MNLIIRDGIIDRYTTNDEFNELENIISEDLRRVLIYLGECAGPKEELIDTIEKIREIISRRHLENENLEISLVDNYVVFNIIDPLSTFYNTQSEIPEIVIMKRQMNGIYFLKSLEKIDIVTDKAEYLQLHQINYQAQYYSYSNHLVTSSKVQFPAYIKDDFEEPFFKTEQFMKSLNKKLSKIIIFNNREPK